MRGSSQDFEEYKEVYKDLPEGLNPQLALVAGINTLVKRCDHDTFAKGVHVTKGGNELAPSTRGNYADVFLGSKILDLDDPWYAINLDALYDEFRNAIAHNKIDYEDVSQTIT